MNAQLLLELRGISKFYGLKPILRSVSAALHEGTITLVTGANGAGKSTLLRVMAGLARPDQGEIIRGAPSIGYLGHSSFLYADLTAIENLRFWARVMGKQATSAELDTILNRYGLKTHADERTRHFSRGMTQKLSFCRLALQRPALLLLDEPFSGLDAESREVMAEDIRKFRDQGAASVIVGHAWAEDSRLADEAIFLNNGAVEFMGPPGQFPDARKKRNAA